MIPKKIFSKHGLTVLGKKTELVLTNTGHLTYWEWCQSELRRINARRIRARLVDNGDTCYLEKVV